VIGQTLSHYRVEEKLGEGGMGVVYRARDLSLNRSVAIKFISSDVADATRRARFQREAQAASSLNHPNIVTVHEAGTVDGRQYIVTELIDGVTLREWSRRERPSVRRIVELAIGIADALACAHRAGILHGKSILVAAAAQSGSLLYSIRVDGGPPVQWLERNIYNPLYSPDAGRIVYLESPQLTMHQVGAVTSRKEPIPLPRIFVGAQRDGCRFLPDSKGLIILLGERRHENFWLLDFETGRLRQLTNLQPGYSVSGFDVSPNGKEILFDRVRENSDIVLIDLPR